LAKDYYGILGVPKNASSDVIKKAYRKLAMQYHPDKNPGKEAWANEKFKEINEAYAVLGDPEKRKRYDQFGTAGNIGDIFGSQYTRGGFEDMMKDFRGAGLNYDFMDGIFGDLLKNKGFSFRVYSTGFGAGQGGFGGLRLDDLLRQFYSKPRPKVEYKITVTGDEAVKGVEKDLKRKGKKIRVKIPAGIKTGTAVKLRGAMKITDGVDGDIFIRVKIK